MRTGPRSTVQVATRSTSNRIRLWPSTWPKITCLVRLPKLQFSRPPPAHSVPIHCVPSAHMSMQAVAAERLPNNRSNSSKQSMETGMQITTLWTLAEDDPAIALTVFSVSLRGLAQGLNELNTRHRTGKRKGTFFAFTIVDIRMSVMVQRFLFLVLYNI